MQAVSIVETFDILEDVSPSVAARVVIAFCDEFAFQRRKEALHRRVVPAVALAAHRTDHAVLLQPVAVAVGRILHAAIGVLDGTRRGPPARNGMSRAASASS
jgi:hypothetical protein